MRPLRSPATNAAGAMRRHARLIAASSAQVKVDEWHQILAARLRRPQRIAAAFARLPAAFSSRLAPRRSLAAARSAITPRLKAVAAMRWRTFQLPSKCSACTGATAPGGRSRAAASGRATSCRASALFSRFRRLRSRLAAELRRCRGIAGPGDANSSGGCGGGGGSNCGGAVADDSRRASRAESPLGRGGGATGGPSTTGGETSREMSGGVGGVLRALPSHCNSRSSSAATC